MGAQITQAGLEKYSAYVVADSPTTAAASGSVRVTYLGVNGYQFETGGHSLLVDPYFTRTNLWRVAFNQPIAPDIQAVNDGCRHLSNRIDAVLVTHAHFDHLLDVPVIMQKTGAHLLSGSSAIHLVESLGTPAEKCEIVRPGSLRQIGPWKIRVYAAQHDRLLGSVPYPGNVAAKGKTPVRPKDWKMGEALAFVIEGGGKTIYVDSGGVSGSSPPAIKVDLAILGVALSDSRARYPEAVRTLRPRYILPSHQDDFFSPFDRGFSFGKLSDFPDLLRQQEDGKLPGKIILLDYFRPWTLP